MQTMGLLCSKIAGSGHLALEGIVLIVCFSKLVRNTGGTLMGIVYKQTSLWYIMDIVRCLNGTQSCKKVQRPNLGLQCSASL